MNHIKLFAILFVTLISVPVVAETEPTHKHYKATMSGESHNKRSEQDSAASKEATPDRQTHKHHKATMPKASHQEYVDSQGSETSSETDEDTKKQKTHKHGKATMSGEKHNSK